MSRQMQIPDKDCAGRAGADPCAAGFDALLTPQRSLSPRGFVVFMTAVSAISFIAGIIFWSIGAWPVMGFFGLDGLAIYVAFKLNYRAARQSERVTLAGDRLSIARLHRCGRVEAWHLNPYWARVHVEALSQERSQVVLASHGERLVLGTFLNDAEKRSFADALADALSAYRGRAPA